MACSSDEWQFLDALNVSAAAKHMIASVWVGSAQDERLAAVERALTPAERRKIADSITCSAAAFNGRLLLDSRLAEWDRCKVDPFLTWHASVDLSVTALPIACMTRLANLPPSHDISSCCRRRSSHSVSMPADAKALRRTMDVLTELAVLLAAPQQTVSSAALSALSLAVFETRRPVTADGIWEGRHQVKDAQRIMTMSVLAMLWEVIDAALLPQLLALVNGDPETQLPGWL